MTWAETAVPTTPTSNNQVTLNRYHVSFRRADGRNTPGVDVPYAFDGAATITVPIGNAAGVTFELVRHVAKSETPLVQLINNFTIITTIADVTFYGQGVAVGDYDSDGDVDLFVSAVGPNKAEGEALKTEQGTGANRLFRNDGGRFVDVTVEAGVAGCEDDWGTSCGFLDYDNDGDLDLFVANYVKWTRAFDKAQPFTLTGGERAYGRPQDFPGTFPYLYRNEGGGKFTEVGKSAGLQVANPARKNVAAGKSLGVTFADFDSDGWLDIVVANDTVQNFLFHNKQDGTFEELAQERGVAFDQQGQARGAMGIDAARIRNGSAVAIAIGNFANEMTAFYVAQGDSMQFTDEAIATGIGPQSRLELKFGTLFVDVDLDGRLDIVSANGHLENEINKVQSASTTSNRRTSSGTAAPPRRPSSVRSRKRSAARTFSNGWSDAVQRPPISTAMETSTCSSRRRVRHRGCCATINNLATTGCESMSPARRATARPSERKWKSKPTRAVSSAR